MAFQLANIQEIFKKRESIDNYSTAYQQAYNFTLPDITQMSDTLQLDSPMTCTDNEACVIRKKTIEDLLPEGSKDAA